MEKMEESKYFLLLHKKLTGQLTTAELRELNRWLQESTANQETAEQVEAVWQAGKAYRQSYEPDVQKGFAAFQARLEREEVDAPVVSLPARRRVLRWAAAASVLLIFGLTVIWQVLAPEHTPPQVYAADDAVRELNLTDGSVVWLNKGSRLTVNADFGESDRQLSLQGEAFFSVSHDASRPFIVSSKSGQTKVLGTEFNVRAYPEEDFEEVVVKSGKVEYRPLKGRQKTILTANQKTVFYRSTGDLQSVVDTTRNALAWQTGEFNFQGTPLKDVLNSIERAFRIQIDLTAVGPVLDCPYSSRHRDAEPRDVLEAIVLTFDMQLEQEGPDAFRLIGGRSCS